MIYKKYISQKFFIKPSFLFQLPKQEKTSSYIFSDQNVFILQSEAEKIDSLSFNFHKLNYIKNYFNQKILYKITNFITEKLWGQFTKSIKNIFYKVDIFDNIQNDTSRDRVIDQIIKDNSHSNILHKNKKSEFNLAISNNIKKTYLLILDKLKNSQLLINLLQKLSSKVSLFDNLLFDKPATNELFKNESVKFNIVESKTFSQFLTFAQSNGYCVNIKNYQYMVVKNNKIVVAQGFIDCKHGIEIMNIRKREKKLVNYINSIKEFDGNFHCFMK